MHQLTEQECIYFSIQDRTVYGLNVNTKTKCYDFFFFLYLHVSVWNLISFKMNLFLNNQIFKMIADFWIASKMKCKKYRKSVSSNNVSSCFEVAVKVLQMLDANGKENIVL